MSFSRRRFLLTSSLTAVAAKLAATRSAVAQTPHLSNTKKSATAQSAQSLQEWDDVRGLFDLDPAYIHLALFYFASHPRPVREAIAEYRKKLDANPFL